jgi:hypothetical protein
MRTIMGARDPLGPFVREPNRDLGTVRPLPIGNSVAVAKTLQNPVALLAEVI